MHVKRILIFLLFIILTLGFVETTLAQTAVGAGKKIDSLKILLKNPNQDTNRLIRLNYLASHYANGGLFDSCLLYSEKAFALNTVLASSGILKGKNARVLLYEKAASYINMGLVYWNKGDYSKARDYFFKTLKVYEELKNKKGMAKCYLNLGLVYWNQGDYPKALEYDFKSLRLDEELGEKNFISLCLGNIGAVYWNQGDYPKALDYFLKALKMEEELGNKTGIARQLGNVGVIYEGQKKYPKALEYYFRALKITEEIKNKNGMADQMANIGTVYAAQKNYEMALQYDFKALKVAEEVGDKSKIALTMGYIGDVYTLTKKVSEAEKYLIRSIAIFDSIGALSYKMQMENQLSDLYLQTGKYQKAFEHYKKGIEAKDSIFSEERKKQIVQKEMNFEFEKKEAIAKADQEKKDAIALQEKGRQKIITNSVAAGLVLVLLLAIFIFRSYRIKQKANIELGLKNELIEKQKQAVEKQKNIIEEKNIQITDSIEYASSIQHAILPADDKITQIFPESFVLFLPKDIVSGDFYWISPTGAGTDSEQTGEVLFAAIDCTGHGVPGAFMSVMAFNMLENIIAQEKIRQPSLILDKLNETVIKTLHQETENTSAKYGMDIALIGLDKKSGQLEYAGAHNSLYLIRENELMEIKADKTTIGMAHGKFNNHKVAVKKGDMLYLFTDGYADQKGGTGGKKFFSATFKELLLSIHAKKCEEQKEILLRTFTEWRGSHEQIDDVLVVGICV